MINKFIRNFFLVYGVAFLLLISGCASSPTIPYGGTLPPRALETLVIQVKDYNPSGWDLPVSAYRIPNSSIVVLDLNKEPGSSPLGLLFGPLGLLAQSEGSKAAVPKSLSEEKIQFLNLKMASEKILKNMLLNSKYKLAAIDQLEKPVFIITPRTWIVVNKKNEIGISTAIGLEWVDSSGVVAWKNDYESRATDVRPLAGETGWFSGEGKYLNEEMQRGLEKTLSVFLNPLINR